MSEFIVEKTYQKYIKRVMDFILAIIAIVLFAPVFLIVAFLVKVKLGSPIIFKQERPGLNEKVFKMYKFRTMTDQTDDNGNLLPDDERLTRFGLFLRSTSLDELPELINIIKGDMSIVGPRPLLVQYLELYSPQQKRRHEVRPGLTGLAQVSGRNSISWDDKFNKDIEYVEHISFLGDWRIILLTFKRVVTRDGINSDGKATMEVFKG